MHFTFTFDNFSAVSRKVVIFAIINEVMDNKISNYIADNVAPDIAKQYDEFCDWIHNRNECSQNVTSSIFASIDFKKQLAKRIVKSLLYEKPEDDFHITAIRLNMDSMDVRLRSLINYYLSVEILCHPEIPEEKIRWAKLGCSRASYIEGWAINDTSEEAIVRMRPGDELYKGYRFFIVNMLCFTADRFVLGFRTDNGPINSPMKHYKGCKPLGNRRSGDGTEWNAIMFDRALSDDHLAIFSNELDGEGTIEMCDWLSDHEQRVIYRHSY